MAINPINPLIPLQSQAADVGGAFSNALLNINRIDQIKQGRQEAPARQQLLESQAATAQANVPTAQDIRLKSVVNAAVELNRFDNDSDRLAFAQKRRADLIEQQKTDPSINTEDTDQYINKLEAGDSAGAQALIDNTINAGRQVGIVGATEGADLQREKLDLRKEELDARNAERALKEETNTLRREELTLKLDQKRVKIRQDKLKIDGDAKAKIRQQGALSTSIDEFVKNDAYMEAVTGVRGRVPAVTTTGFEAEALFDNIKNNLTLENLDKMTGVLSETDIKILSTAATALQQGMGKKVMIREFKKIQDVLKDKSADVQAKLLGSQSAPATTQQPDAATQGAPKFLGFE